MPGFRVTFTGGHVNEKSSVKVYCAGEQAHTPVSSAVALPVKKESAIMHTYLIHEEFAIVLGLAILCVFL